MPIKRPHILFLFSDTGGGHRSATEAIIEALTLEYDERISTEMVDIFKDYAPQPLNRASDIYPHLVRLPQAWELAFRISDGPRRTRMIVASAWPYVYRKVRELLDQNPCNMIVSVHPIANMPLLWSLGPQHLPFITVVTDLVSTHAFWFHPQVDLTIVPTEMARHRALACGLKPEQVQIIGLPVADRFCQPPGDKVALRARLGWPVEDLVILLVGGGEGMGPIEKVAQAVAQSFAHSFPPVALVIVSGRNKQLKERLEGTTWPIKTFIYGFVREMPDFMRAADILVTKAGPGTICEAFNAGLPLILYSRLPGQEDGNVTYVTSQGAGIWAPHPELIVAALRYWVDSPQARFQAVAACKRIARPTAAREIARLLADRLGVKLDRNNATTE